MVRVGPIVDVNQYTRNGGAGITLTAGVGANGLNYSVFANRYFDAANLADPSLTLAEQPGKVVKTYEAELFAWLQTRFGYGGDAADALAYFAALPAEQQGVFVRQVYFTELALGGREYNDASSRRFGSIFAAAGDRRCSQVPTLRVNPSVMTATSRCSVPRPAIRAFAPILAEPSKR